MYRGRHHSDAPAAPDVLRRDVDWGPECERERGGHGLLTAAVKASDADGGGCGHGGRQGLGRGQEGHARLGSCRGGKGLGAGRWEWGRRVG